jgi:phage shock protein A
MSLNVAIARKARREINKLQGERDKLYRKALKALSLPDTNWAFDYFYNSPNEGYSTFEEEIAL